MEMTLFGRARVILLVSYNQLYHLEKMYLIALGLQLSSMHLSNLCEVLRSVFSARNIHTNTQTKQQKEKYLVIVVL